MLDQIVAPRCEGQRHAGEPGLADCLGSFEERVISTSKLILNLVLDTAPVISLTSERFGRRVMKVLRVAALSLLAGLCAAPVHADSVPPGDPRIRQGGGDPANPTPIISPAFYILSPTGTSPAPGSPCELFQSIGGVVVMTGTSPNCLFENVINPSGTGQNITSLVFDVLHPGGMVTCALINTINFKTCTTGSFDDGGAMVTFSNGSIPFQTDFSLQFTGFPENTQAGCSPISTCPPNTTTSSVPEPGTLVLFFGGIGALLIGRRLHARNLS